MQTEDMISANEFCTYHHVEFSFLNALKENGLIEVYTVEQTEYIPESKLQQLEKLVRMHYDLQINLEGIEAITYLLQRVENLQEEVLTLKNTLKVYER